MLVTDLKKGDFYKFSHLTLRTHPGLCKGPYLHQGDHSFYLGVRDTGETRYVPWEGHEKCDVVILPLSDKEIYELSQSVLQ